MARITQIPWTAPRALGRTRAETRAVAELQRALAKRAGRLGKLTRAQEDDLVQTALERLLARYGDALWTWDSEKRLAYAYTTLHRLFLDDLKRRRASLTPDGQVDTADPAPSTERLVAKRQLALRVHGCMEQLAPGARRFLLQSFALDSTSEAQRSVGWPGGSAANACHTRKRLLRSIKDCLARRERK